MGLIGSDSGSASGVYTMSWCLALSVMTRTAPVLVAVVLVVGTLAAFPVAGLAAQTDDTETETPQTTNASENASVAPGAQLSGVVGVGEAELEGDVESRAYGIQVAQAKTNEARADVVADRLNASEKQMDDLEAQKQGLDEARANGSMSEGEYSAKVAAVHARTQSVDHITNQTNETAQGLPVELLEQKGINATAIQTLKDRASDLSGPETAAIARSIAGNNVGQAGGPDVADDRGQAPDNASDGVSDDETDAEDNETVKPDAGNETAGGDEMNETDGSSGAGNGQSDR